MPRLLDLFCGAGGCSVGYQRAGFDVVGVDINPQPNYRGGEFIQADAMTFPLDGFDVIHASPPCQRYSVASKSHNGQASSHPDLVSVVRDRLRSCPTYVIENVVGSPLESPVLLCGTMFSGLRVLRHRLFESNIELQAQAHPSHPLCFTMDKRKPHYGKLDEMASFVQVTGGGNCSVAAARDAMGIDWMSKRELNNAIPPAYTEWIGRQINHLTGAP